MSVCTAPAQQMCYVSWMACPSLLLRLGLSQWRWPAWRRTKTHMVMLVVQADRPTPSKHCASNPGVQPGKRWFCLHSFWADHPDLQGEWRRTWLRHSLSLQEEEKKPSWVQESLQVQLWLPHSPQGKLDFTFPRRLVQRSLETRCVGPSTGLWFPTMLQSLALSQFSSQGNEARGRKGRHCWQLWASTFDSYLSS